jgi:hypothetical protein
MSDFNYGLFFIGWSTMLVFVFSIKAINYYFNKKKLDTSSVVESLPSLKDVGFASFEIFVYEGMAYWIEDGSLYRAQHQDVVHVNTKELVDPLNLNQGEIDLDEYMAILTKVEAHHQAREQR